MSCSPSFFIPPFWRLAIFFSDLAGTCPTVRAQGPLTPPGAPAATMKTLDQVEARTVVNAVNTPTDGASAFAITQPGSYCPTGNLTVLSGNTTGISASAVTLDLNGFTIASTGAVANGKTINAVTGQDLVIHLGYLRGTTTYNGTAFGGGSLSKASMWPEGPTAASKTPAFAA